ncbi:MAG: hypothetical protein FH756_01630 [Firmicutes bacterium]|nr:hypothetical protein [Bacillota bacterium]
MASGCIIADCWVCEELIWEDEPWEIVNDELIHESCVGKATNTHKQIIKLKEQMRRLENKVRKLEKEERDRING